MIVLWNLFTDADAAIRLVTQGLSAIHQFLIIIADHLGLVRLALPLLSLLLSQRPRLLRILRSVSRDMKRVIFFTFHKIVQLAQRIAVSNDQIDGQMAHSKHAFIPYSYSCTVHVSMRFEHMGV